MAKVRNREDALLDAYLGRYKSAQASTVSEGQSKTKSAQQKGSALLNATDKTLPALKNTYSDTLQNIVSGASMENSLNNDVMQRSMNLAKAKFDAANDLYEQQKKAQEYAEKQAKAAQKKSSGKSGSSGSTTSTADDAAAKDALNKLGIGSNTTSKAKSESGTTGKSSNSSNSKTDNKKKEKSVNPLTKALQDKQAAANTGANRGKTTGKSYAEQSNAQKVSTQSIAAAKQVSGKGNGKGAQSQSLTGVAKAVGGILTAPARAGNEEEKRKQWQARQLMDSGQVFTKDGKINSRYKELESDSGKDKRSVGSRAADLVKGVGKQALGAIGTAFLAPTSGGSKENKQAQYKMRQMMDNGTVFTADGGINEDYRKALSDFDAAKDKQDVLSEQFVPTLGLIREGQNQIARGGEGLTGAGKGLYDTSAMFANMVPGMALGVVNPALGAAYMGATSAGSKIAEQTEKGRGSRDATLRGAASGLIEAGTNALPIGEFAKTVKTGSPILQSALKEGIENAGQEAASYLLNTAADYALKDPDANFSLQDMAGQVGMGAATGAAFGALGGALGKAFGRTDTENGRAGDARPYTDEAQAGSIDDWQETPDIFLRRPVDETAQTAYNMVNGGVDNENVGRYVQEPVSVSADNMLGIQPESGNVPDGLYGTNGKAGQGTAAQGNGRGAEGTGTASVPTVAERASAITGKDMRSPYTRRIASLFERLGNGESRENLAGEAKDIALGIVSTDDFTTPVDESTNVLKDYLKNTQIKIDEQTKGELLNASGLKTLQQYNIRNGTHFSMKSGVDYDAAIPEVYGMMGGENRAPDGNAADALMQLVNQSKQKALVDSDAYTAYTDYVADSLLNGQRPDTEGFTDWLETQGFDKNANEAVQNMYVREFEYDPWGNSYNPNVLNRAEDVPAAQSVPALDNQTAQSVSEVVPTLENQAQPLSGNLPENAVGAEKAVYSEDKIVENKDYANQAAARTTLDEAHRQGLTDSTHRVWSDSEAQKQALYDISTYIQSAGGDVDKGLDNAMNDLKKVERWDKGESVTANSIRDRLRTEYMKTEPGTPEFYQQRARYDAWVGEISSQRSKTAQTMQSFTGDAKARVYEVSGPIREKWETQHTSDKAKIERLSRELEKLKQDNADFVAGKTEPEKFISDVTNHSNGTSSGTSSVTAAAGPMDDEFSAMLKSEGIPSLDERIADMPQDAQNTYKTKTSETFDKIAAKVKELANKNNVKIDDDTAKTIAGKVMNGENAESYYNSLISHAAGISELSIDEMEIVDDLYSKAATLPDSKERYQLEQQAINIMAQHLPAKSWFERFDNVRYLAMLGNPTTHARNLIGNTMMTGMTGAKDEVAAAMQLVLPKKARTKALYTPKEMLDAADNYINTEAYTRVLKDGGRYNLDSGIERARSTYGKSIFGRALQKASDVNSNLLDKEDEIFLALGAKRSLASNLTAKGYDASIFTKTDAQSKAVVEAALEQAITDAKDMTFHADNALTKNLSKISNLGDKRGSICDKLFYMIGNGLLPFAKTPGNILKTAAEYNPVGSAVEAVYRGATGKGAAAVTDALAKGVVGSALMGIGWWLADEGLITGSLGDTEDYDKMLGKQSYSLNIPGKGSYSIDWAAPSVVPVFMGANLAQNGADLSDILKDPVKYAGQVTDILTNALDPVTQMSLLSSVNDTLESLKYDNGTTPTGTLLASLGTNYVRQFIPTLGSKIARTVDPVRRSTYGGGDTPSERNANYLLRSTMNKIPGLSKNLEPYVDQWGREEASVDGTDDSAGGMFLRGLYNMGSPGYYSAENVTPVDEYLQGLYSDTNNSKVLPEKASSKLTLDKETYYMTPEEKTEYAKTTGQTAYDMVDSLRQNEMFLQLPDDQQAELVQDAYTLAKTAGGVAAVGDGVSGTDSKVYKAYEQGGVEGATDYLLAKNAVDVAKGDSDTGSLNDVGKWNAVSGQMVDSAIDQFVTMTKEDSLVRRIYDTAGGSAAAAYMDAYSAASAGLGEDETPSKYDVGIGMMRQGVRGDDLAKAYLSAYNKTDKAGTSIYGQYGSEGLEGWIMYKATAYNVDKSGNNNGKIDKDEAIAALNAMDLTNELRRAYLTKTNKIWKNPY